MKTPKPEWLSKMPDTSKKAYFQYLDGIKLGDDVLNYWSWVEQRVDEFLKANPEPKELEA